MKGRAPPEREVWWRGCCQPRVLSAFSALLSCARTPHLKRPAAGGGFGERALEAREALVGLQVGEGEGQEQGRADEQGYESPGQAWPARAVTGKRADHSQSSPAAREQKAR